MKTENVIGLIGLLAVAGLVAFFALQYDALVVTPPASNVPTQNSQTSAGNTNATALSFADIANHNTPADCWVIIRAKVYDVTNYLVRHPGGAFRITPYCGTDATTAFATQGGTGSHSSVAENELANLYLGEAPTSAIVPTNVNSNTNTAPSTNAPVPTPTSSTVTLDALTIAKHATASDCWIIVNNSVYAVTTYLNMHPGGAFRITPYCGKDATTAFATQGGSGTHSSAASADLAALRIGAFGSTTTTNTLTQVQTNSSTLTTGNGEREEENDD